MKLFSSEVGQNYGSYSFGYAQYVQREPGDEFAAVYQSGYLPYSGAQGITDVFYMARSARVALKEFVLTSENRRIAKKFDDKFACEHVPLKDFNADAIFYDFCLAYFAKKHGERAMPRERLRHILQCGLVTDVLLYQENGKPVAYVLEIGGKMMGHYWFSFYDLAYASQSLGLWLMLDALRRARERGLEHYYLGTVYGPKALYKTNFEPLEWWNGAAWSRDIGALKARGRGDEARAMPLVDEWKGGLKLF